ncbi:MAG: 50S ribosomal protein L11 methyltransferase [Acidobacteria bacterium]|nr:MAG: 50S ribosomal protein L11 methyltransferase [Acidobacteriota bacterium]
MKWESAAVPTVDQWYAVDVAIEPNAREAVDYGLMEAGALGTEFRETDLALPTITAYFKSLPDREAIQLELAEALHIYSLPSSAVCTMNVRTVENQDWLLAWKQSWQPIEVGERFLIAPPWSQIADTRGRILIRIEPGMAFGTGTHETTRLSLRAIEKYFQGGSLLDVGTGTGLLAIAAAKLFQDAAINAYDIDAEAVEIAKQNAKQNSVEDHITFRTGTIDETTPSADLVCANLSASTIVELLPVLIGATCGRLVLSGLLDSQLELIREKLEEHGISEIIEISQDGEWIAVVV